MERDRKMACVEGSFVDETLTTERGGVCGVVVSS
jgi:hypothetical protein